MPEPQDSVNNAPPAALAPLLPLAGIVEDLAADAAARRLAKSEGKPLGPWLLACALAIALMELALARWSSHANA